MKFKKLIYLFLGILAFILVGGFSLLAFLSYKIRDVKEPLIAAFKSRIDGDVKIGDAKVVMFPTGIDLKDVQLFAPGETTPSASIQNAHLRFNLIPLIQKKIETSVEIQTPEIVLRRGKDGKTNMEKIFAPMIKGESKEDLSKLDKLWWKRLAVEELTIDRAHFIATEEGKPDVTELRDLSIKADHIRFESSNAPANIDIHYALPRVSKAPMELKTQMIFDDSRQSLKLQDGKFLWGSMTLDFGGDVQLPQGKQQDVALNLNFSAKDLDLKDLAKNLVEPLAAAGKLSLQGTIQGTAFSPILAMSLDAPSLSLSGKSLSNLHAELKKSAKPVEIKNTSFGIYGGSVGLSGQLIPGPTTAASLNIALKSLSLAAMSGSPGSARLSGNLQMSGSNIQNPAGFSGGGRISAGPFPLPVINLQNKVKVADILTAGTSLGRMVNVGMLSSSANVIGTQVDQVNANVHIAGGNITLAPFSMGNSHFNASGNGTIIQQKSISASGTFTLNSGVTAALLPDPRFRSVITSGKGALSVPFSASGPLADPNISVDSGYLKSLAAKATAMGLTNLLAGGLRPNDMINSALKNTPLGNPNSPLGQILGTSQPPPNSNPPPRTSTRPTSGSKTSTASKNTASKPVSGNKLVDQLFFGR